MTKRFATLLTLALLGAGAVALLPAVPLAAAHSCGHTNLSDSPACDAHVCPPTGSHNHRHRPLALGPTHYCYTTPAATSLDVWIPVYGVDGGSGLLP